MTHDQHLIEERLFDCYLAERAGESVDPRVIEHLADCGSCGARYTDLATFMDALEKQGVAESDAVFTPDRLHAQQQQIARRIEAVGQRARVLSFPRRFVRGTIAPSSTHAAPRWMAAAAAAGLFIGVAVGASYNYRPHNRAGAAAVAAVRPQSVAPAVSAEPAALPVATRGDQPASVATDDAFLSELEIALERPHTRELQAFDALTPHFREIRLNR